MAANKQLDIATCTTASEAFKHPLPQIRQFHRSLTTELDGKNARLRTLVGGSYRQLLGTAETILQMRENIGLVEDRLGRVGKGCGRTVVNGMAGGLGKLQGKLREGRGAEELGWVARLKVLEMCTVVIGKLLRKGASPNSGNAREGRGKNLVVAAKVWVLSRLLAKSLSDAVGRTKAETALVEDSRKKLAALKNKLSRIIERSLQRTGGSDSREALVQALCAYSLATSSGTKDVIRHFLRVRNDAIKQTFHDITASHHQSPSILRALRFYTRTLLDVQALVPRRLPEALLGLKAKPLLKDVSIRELEGLRLDVSEQWFGDEIMFFTPYIRHDDLDFQLAVEILKDWADKASEALLEGFSRTLELVVEFKTVVELRTHIFDLWIKEGGKAKGFDPTVILNGFREVINTRMIQLIESRVSKLHLVGTEIEGTLGAWKEGFTDQHSAVWDQEILEAEISNGATSFRQGVLARTFGRSDAVSRAIKGYQTWRRLIDEMITMLGQLKKQRWDDDLEDIEDDLSIETRNNLLSKEDPRMLQDHLDSGLRTSFAELQKKITHLLEMYTKNQHTGQISLYTLRIIRDIRSELPENPALQAFGLPLVPSLHTSLAAIISQDPIVLLAKPLNKRKVVGRALWEGDPELPVQPSPRIFKFLYNLTLTMADVGGDVWSPAAVRALKEHLLSELASTWSSLIEALDEQISEGATNPAANGVMSGDESHSEPTPDTTEESVESDEVVKEDSAEVVDSRDRREILTQSLFDILVLHNFLDTGKDADNALQEVGNSVEKLIELDPSSRKRLDRGAKEYWRRTSLLFGLLS